MADFDLAVKKILAHEGGYANVGADPGGETVFGISRRAHGDHDLFKRLDALKKSMTIPNIEKDAMLIGMAKDIYRKHYWESLGLTYISNQAIAEQVFDMAVTAGTKKAGVLLQQALNTMDFGLVEDGIIGTRTRSALDQAISIARQGIIALYQAYRMKYYLSLHHAGMFIHSWARRTFDS